MKTKIVSGYVPLGNMPHRSDAQYRASGERIKALETPTRIFEDYALEECWLYQYLQTLDWQPEVAHGNNSGKNTLAYHIVQHQKSEWLAMATREDPEPEVFVWVDYAIFKDDVTEGHIYKMLGEVNTEAIAAPGYMTKDCRFGYTDPHWRFCGSVLVCPRQYIEGFAAAVRDTAIQEIDKTRHVTWEVNTWATIDRLDILPIRQYHASHDGGMFAAYLNPPTVTGS